MIMEQKPKINLFEKLDLLNKNDYGVVLKGSKDRLHLNDFGIK